MRVFNQIALNNVNATANSSVVDTGSTVYISFTGVTTGTIAGTAKLQVSNEFDVSGEMKAFTPQNWVDLPGSSATLSGTAGTFLIPKIDVSYRWMRLVLTVSGGTGTCTAWVKGCNF